MFVRVPLHPGQWYLDGGLRHNNPSKLALDEAPRIWPTVKQFCLVGIGTGWQQSMESIIHQRLLDNPNSQDPAQQCPYYRFNVERCMDSVGLEEWKAIVRIEELTARYMSEGDTERKKKACAEILLKPSQVEHM